MTGQQRKNRLLEAEELIQEVLNTLDIEAHRCPHCAMLKRMNFAEFQASEELTAVCRKLIRFANDPRICPMGDSAMDVPTHQCKVKRRRED